MILSTLYIAIRMMREEFGVSVTLAYLTLDYLFSFVRGLKCNLAKT